jgi:hypothetical protein
MDGRMNNVNDLKSKIDDLVADLDPIQHLQNLDYPRRAGSDGDRRGVDYIAQTLRAFGIEPSVQAFQFAKPKLLRRLILPLVLLAWTALSLVNIRLWDSNPVVSLFVLLLPATLLGFILSMSRLMPCFLSRRRKNMQQTQAKIEAGELPPERVIASQNVLATVGPEDAEYEILFTAHHDSIASQLPRRIILPFALLGSFGFVLYSLAYLANLVAVVFFERDYMGAYYPAFAVLALAACAGLETYLISRLFRSNASHGIIDDGTGVAILLELAKHLKAHPIPGYRFTFGFFGAEEAGLVGSAHYYMRRRVAKDNLRVITVDMIGERPPLGYVKGLFFVGMQRMGALFNAQIVEIAQALEIELKGKRFPYPGSDFGHFFLDAGCTANWLISGSRLIHSKRDNLDNLNQDLVRDALKLMVAYLPRLAQEQTQGLAQPAGRVG